MERMIYPVQLTPDSVDGGFTVTCRDFPEVITQGDTLADCLVEAADCLEEAIASRIKRGADIPEPSALLGSEQLVAVPLSMSLKAVLYQAMKEDGISKSELARRMGCDEKDVRRMLDPRHPTKAPAIEKALALLGRRVVVGIRKAA
ncbi:MAG TPA: type II toxin-antitoxin system HicB family antitoxin [Thermodesulfobacteriota bacterium]|nr:type II toxin-antitoxin system HicB family antitoxin [Thermodesulfobacteriota bacterium]